MSNDEKPEEIRRIEERIGKPLRRHAEGEILGWKNKGCFQLDAAGRVVGLNLLGYDLSDVSFLSGLTQLTRLDLRGNQISDVSFLSGLTQLTTLDLSGNQISDYSFLSGLTQLTTLYLGGNEISDVSFLSGLTQLTTLYLSRNEISDVSFLSGLTQLTALDLSENQISRLSDDVYALGLTIVSNEYRTLNNSVNIFGNPLTDPPLEIVEQGHAAIMKWREAARQGERRLNEVKVILVGDGGAGKTSLRKRLMGEAADPQESQTHGIEINKFSAECADGRVLVHFWDFGGQEIMHATHQFFLSHRSLYVLVLDGRKEEDPEYWLKHIEAFGGDSPILVVLSKIDENPGFEVNRKELHEKYKGIKGFERVNSLDESDPGIRRLRDCLTTHLATADMAKSTWPRLWFDVKTQVETDGKPYMETSEFHGICKAKGVVDEGQQRTLIRYLNDLGVALHFEDARLKLLQILNPRWATQAVYRIINDPGVAAAQGVLDLGRLDSILAYKEEGHFTYPEDKHAYIVELMKKFELCYEFRPNQLLLPDLLGVQEPKFAFPKSEVLRFRYEYGFLPTSIIQRLIVKLHADIDGYGKLRWRTGVALKSDESRAVVRADKSRRWISIEVAGVRRRDYFSVIRHNLESIHKEFQKIEIKSKVPLPDAPDHAVDYEDLLFHEEKLRKTILVGELRREYVVKNLLDGIEPPVKRQQRRVRAGREEKIIIAGKYYEGHDMGENYDVKIGHNATNIAVGKGITQVAAESIRDSFNTAAAASDNAPALAELLKQLATEVEKIAHAKPEKAEELADDLKTVTDQALAEKPNKKYWEVGKKGIIEAAQAVGAVGTVAIGLVKEINELLGW